MYFEFKGIDKKNKKTMELIILFSTEVHQICATMHIYSSTKLLFFYEALKNCNSLWVFKASNN